MLGFTAELNELIRWLPPVSRRRYEGLRGKYRVTYNLVEVNVGMGSALVPDFPGRSRIYPLLVGIG